MANRLHQLLSKEEDPAVTALTANTNLAAALASGNLADYISQASVIAETLRDALPAGSEFTLVSRYNLSTTEQAQLEQLGETLEQNLGRVISGSYATVQPAGAGSRIVIGRHI